MIYYDSHSWWRTLFTFRGSVLPRAFLYSVPSAALAVVLKRLEILQLISLYDFEELNSGTVYQGFTFVLGFTLVFRTSQAYQRYWVAATSIQEMGSEWSDACSSLIAFAKDSEKPEEEVHKFMHTVVRLFCLLHALSLEELASLKDENFPILDISGFSEADLRVLLRPEVEGKRTKIVLCWIKRYVVQSLNNGILKVPPPILSRVFQELGLGLINFHQAQQVCIWPFPFPYTQLNVLLVGIYMGMTPLVIATWDTQPWVCGFVTLLSTLCMQGLSLIAAELENPLGEDVNDLPAFEMQHQQNRDLVLLLNPQVWIVPTLLPTHQTFEDLIEQDEESRLSLQQYQKEKGKTKAQHMLKSRSFSKLDAQMKWAGHKHQAQSDHNGGSVSKLINQNNILSMDEECQNELAKRLVTRISEHDVGLRDVEEKPTCYNEGPTSRADTSAPATTLRDFTGDLVSGLEKHLDQLQAQLQQHLDQHLKQQGNLHKGQLAALERIADKRSEGGNSTAFSEHRQDFSSGCMSSSALGGCGAPAKARSNPIAPQGPFGR